MCPPGDRVIDPSVAITDMPLQAGLALVSLVAQKYDTGELELAPLCGGRGLVLVLLALFVVWARTLVRPVSPRPCLLHRGLLSLHKLQLLVDFPRLSAYQNSSLQIFKRQIMRRRCMFLRLARMLPVQ
jgi:hypothetical protein